MDRESVNVVTFESFFETGHDEWYLLQTIYSVFYWEVYIEGHVCSIVYISV